MFFAPGDCGGIEDVGLGQRWDRRRLAEEIARRAAVLASMGVGLGSVVAIAHGGSARFFADLLAVWNVRAAAACLDSSLTAMELQAVMDFLRPAAILIDGALPPGTPSIPTLELATARPASAALTGGKRDLNAPALMLFTSGTTGTPKAVVLSFKALKTRIELNGAAIGAAPLKRTLVTLPTHFGHGLIGNALTPLLHGADVVLFPRGIALADQLGRIIDHYAISFLSSVPSFWTIATQSAAPPRKGSLARIHVGSSPLSAGLWSQVAAWSRAEVVNCYGMTETANWMAGASSRRDFIADGFVGRAWGGRAAVRDDRGDICEVGEGEIVVRSPCVMQGYLNRPDLTAEVMAEGWYRTGDRGRVDAAGRIWLTGRIKDEINRAGVKIQPADIDVLLERHPAVAEACAFAIPDVIGGEAVGAAVCLAPGQAIGVDALRSWCRERLHGQAVPGHWFIVDRIPRNARGKVNRAAVRRLLVADGVGGEPDQLRVSVDRKPIEAAEPPTTGGCYATDIDTAPIKEAVALAWSSILGARSLQANLRWSDAGGDSLGGLHLLARIHTQLAIAIPIRVLEGNMRPSELVTEIERLWRADSRKPNASRSDSARPLVFLTPPAYGDVPGLARFREDLAQHLRFQVIYYPPLDAMIRGRGGFAALVDAAVCQVLAACGEGPCLLAGYSFGGFVACEVARRIVASGRQVDFLGLIDSRFEGPPPQGKGLFDKASRYLARTWSQPRKMFGDGLWWLAELLARHGPLPMLRAIDGATMALPASTAFAFRLQLITRIRANSLVGRKIVPLEVATTLFLSQEAASGHEGWEKLCKHLVVRSIGGDHRSLLEAPFRAGLCWQFLEAVEAACRVARWRQPTRCGAHRPRVDR
jgi:oxalate---CoA ligase